MKPSDVKTLMSAIINYNLTQYEKGQLTGKRMENTYVTPFLVGDPGVGKTAILRQVAEELGMPYHQVIIAQMDAGEMAGLPFMSKQEIEHYWIDDKNKEHTEKKTVDRMIRLRPTYLPDPMVKEGQIGIFNLDELPQAFLANQNIASQLVNEYRVGEHEISPGITICATGNKPENKAGTTAMPSHLKDRLMFIEVEVDTEDFLKRAALDGYDPRVRAYIRQNPKYLHQFQVGANASTTPRSWGKASATLSMNLPTHIRTNSLKGQIGEGATVHFETWLRVEDKLPKITDVIEHPETAPIFGNADANILYLLLANLADAATEKNIGNIIKYINRLPNQEFAAYWAQDTFTKNEALLKTAPVTEWKLSKGAKLLY